MVCRICHDTAEVSAAAHGYAAQDEKQSKRGKSRTENETSREPCNSEETKEVALSRRLEEGMKLEVEVRLEWKRNVQGLSAALMLDALTRVFR